MNIERGQQADENDFKKFPKKGCLGQVDHFEPKNGPSSELCIRCKNFSKFYTMKRVNRYMKVVIMACTKKKFVQDKWAILGPKMAHPHNSGSAVRIFLKFCRMKNWDNGL